MVRYQRSASLALSVAVAAGVGTVAVGPAEASTVAPQGASGTAYLCWGYSGCSSAGMGNAGYSAVSRTMYWQMYGGHNCTNYVAYRMVHSGLPNSRPWTGSGNATNWGSVMSRITDGSPAVGAVAWWRAYVSPAGSAGHVAYVEKVVDADTILVSQDSWGGDFSWKRVTRVGGQWPSGFVHFHDLAQRSTAVPTISGTPRVGRTLSATTGSWAMPGASFSYQWRSAGVAVSGATSSSLTLDSARVGKAVRVRVTARTPGYDDVTVTSAATDTVSASALTNTARPSIAGTPRVGTTLTASPGSWSSAGAAFTYQWMSAGAALDGATSPTLTLSPAMVGKRFSVAVTSRLAGYDATSAKAPRTEVVAPGAITMSRPPEVTGTVRPGQTLTLTRGTPTPADATVSLQWLRDGVPVAGATGSAYRLGPADLGHQVSARVTAQRESFAPLVATTEPTRLVRATPTVTVTPTPGRRTLRLAVAVTVPGVVPVTGELGVRLDGIRGPLLGSFPVRNGLSTVSLTRLPAGSQRFRVYLRPTDSVRQKTVWVRATILP